MMLLLLLLLLLLLFCRLMSGGATVDVRTATVHRLPVALLLIIWHPIADVVLHI